MTHLFIAAACSPVAKKSVAAAKNSGERVRIVLEPNDWLCRLFW